MFDRVFERVYNGSGLQVPWYAVLGNHDWRSLSSPALQINATRRWSSRWRMPHPYYSVRVGADLASLTMLDTSTILVDREQIRWAERALAAAATARWRVVVGHHSLFTSGAHRGRTMHRHRALLLPWLEKHRVDLYISGHSHHTEHLQYGRTHFLVVGAGSGLDAAPLCDDNCAPQSVHRFRDALGFATLTLGRDGGEAALRDGLGVTRHSFKF